ncbi:MAG: hypothetical protein RML12_10200 [Xanthomonadales bacterium]|nr:hypothetical protein [Xanthomonadales bacterium]
MGEGGLEPAAHGAVLLEEGVVAVGRGEHGERGAASLRELLHVGARHQPVLGHGQQEQRHPAQRLGILLVQVEGLGEGEEALGGEARREALALHPQVALHRPPQHPIAVGPPGTGEAGRELPLAAVGGDRERAGERHRLPPAPGTQSEADKIALDAAQGAGHRVRPMGHADDQGRPQPLRIAGRERQRHRPAVGGADHHAASNP